MAKTEITKSPATTPARSRGIFSAMRGEMDRVFERFEHGWPHWPVLFGREGTFTVPELDVRENANAIVVEAELPGVDEKDEEGENYHFSERSFGSFERSVRLPETIDEGKVEAKFDKGVLKVTAAKKPEAVKAERRIEIQKT